ncbi:MAG: hypothetical protein CYG59_04255, partial [Chloroflexi bacterium]
LLIQKLARDRGLDRGMVEANREINAAAPLLFADRRLIVNSHVSKMARDLERLFARIGEGFPPIGPFERETEAATQIAELGGYIAPKLDTITDVRWLQARVVEPGNEGTTPVPLGAFRAGVAQTVETRVGPSEDAWISGGTRFPDEELQESDEPHLLTVVFTELRPGVEAQVAEILLPAIGASTVCQFLIRPDLDQTQFEARFSVLYANRVLQTALLRGPVSSPSQPFEEGSTIEFVVEAVVRARMDDLDSRRPFDAAVIVNHNSEYVPLITTIANDLVSINPPAKLEAGVRKIRNLLTQIADDPEKYAGENNEYTAELLFRLAVAGKELGRGLSDMNGNWPVLQNKLSEATLIQVVSVTAEAYLPLEFVYDGVIKYNSKRCMHYSTALIDGKCSHECKNMAPNLRPPCPLHFWGMSKIIEQVRHDPQVVKLKPSDFALHTAKVVVEPTARRTHLGDLDSVLFAASNKVDMVEEDTCYDSYGISELKSRIQEIIQGRDAYVTRWEDWIENVEQQKPSLLVLLPHTETSMEGSRILKIGEDNEVDVAMIGDPDQHFVRDVNNKWPIVLLIGCQTG